MNPQTMTDEQIHQIGIEALVNQLGLLGTIRFLRQYGTGGDYSVDRHQWLNELDVKTLARQIQQAREEKGEESCNL